MSLLRQQAPGPAALSCELLCGEAPTTIQRGNRLWTSAEMHLVALQVAASSGVQKTVASYSACHSPLLVPAYPFQRVMLILSVTLSLPNDPPITPFDIDGRDWALRTAPLAWCSRLGLAYIVASSRCDVVLHWLVIGFMVVRPLVEMSLFMWRIIDHTAMGIQVHIMIYMPPLADDERFLATMSEGSACDGDVPCQAALESSPWRNY